MIIYVFTHFSSTLILELAVFLFFFLMPRFVDGVGVGVVATLVMLLPPLPPLLVLVGGATVVVSWNNDEQQRWAHTHTVDFCKHTSHAHTNISRKKHTHPHTCAAAAATPSLLPLIPLLLFPLLLLVQSHSIGLSKCVLRFPH